VITRLDIAKVVSILSQFLQNPSAKHMQAADQALEYLLTTKYVAIKFDNSWKSTHIFFTGSDSAFTDNVQTRRSSYGYYFMLFSSVIQYKAVKGTTVTISSTKAELLAISATAEEFL